MKNRDGLAWGYALVLGVVSGSVATGWLALTGLDAWGLVVAFVLVALGSRALAGRCGGPSTELLTQDRASGADLLLELDGLLSECMAQFSAQYGCIRDEVGRMESLLADAIATLTRSFNGMHHQGEMQQRRLCAADGADKQSDAQFDESVGNSSAAMGTVGDGLAEPAESIPRRMQQVCMLLSEIAGMARQAALLAPHGAVDGTDTGDANRQIGQEIGGLMEAMQGLIERALQAVQRLAIDSDAASAASDMTPDVARAVTALQFQDMVFQLMGHIKNRIAALDDVVRHFGNLASTLRKEADKGRANDAPMSLQREVARMRQSLADLAATTSHNPVSQNAMSHGDVELF